MNRTATVGNLFDAYELYCYHYYGGKKVLECLSVSTFLSSRLYPLTYDHDTTGRFASDLHIMLAAV